MIASKDRNLESGSSYEKYFDRSKLKRTDPILMERGSVFETLKLMEQTVTKFKSDTEKIAKVLEGTNLEATCRNIFDFVYKHIQYRQDKNGVEQLRRPLRSWADRKQGVDCDCYSIFISSVLMNLGIEHYFRMTKYSQDWQHVYVVVPMKKHANMRRASDYYTIDCVTDNFNYEVRYTKKHDYQMMPIQQLNGFSSSGFSGIHKAAYEFGTEYNLAGLGTTTHPAETFMSATKHHLENTLAIVKSSPSIVEGQYNPAQFIKSLEQLLDNWENAPVRDRMLDELSAMESGLQGQIGGLFKSIRNGVKQAAQAVGGAVSSAATSVATGVKTAVTATGGAVQQAANWTANAATTAVQATGNALKVAANAVVKYNPVSLAIRNGLLLAFKINLFRISERLGYARMSETEARNKGLNVEEHRKLVQRYGRVKNLFKNLQGDDANLENAIQQGWEKGTAKRGIAGLGMEPVTTAAGTAAATGVIAQITSWLKEVDYSKLLERLPNVKELVSGYFNADKEAEKVTDEDLNRLSENPQLKNASDQQLMAMYNQPGFEQSVMSSFPQQGSTGGNNMLLLLGLGGAAVYFLANSKSKRRK
jgi:hypothetical protein